MSTTDAPVAPGDRYDSLDVLRGLAVLMIFTVNVRNMLGPMNTMFDPAYFTGRYDLAIDRVLQYAVDGKWIATFAILFGAGLMLLHEKAVAAGTDSRERIVSRQKWLLAFGLAHLFLIWPGDVLTTYAVMGFLAMLFLHRRSGTVAVWAVLLLAFSVGTLFLVGAAMGFMPEEAATEMVSDFATDLAEEEEIMRGGSVAGHLLFRLEFGLQMLLNSLFMGWMVLGYMLLGILLYRTGFLLARWGVLPYLATAAICLPVAWGVDTLRVEGSGIWDGTATEPYILSFFATMWMGTLDGLFGALGYAALVNLAVRLGLKARPLAAAGRMAFTNYIMCSLIGTTMAYGHAGGRLGQVTLAEAMGLVAIVWLGILVVSPLWLSVFRYGPLEWLWRSLSYGERQPFLKRNETV